MKKRLAALIVALLVIAAVAAAVIVNRTQEPAVETGVSVTDEPIATDIPETEVPATEVPATEPPAMQLGSFLEEAMESGRAVENVTTFVAGKELTGQEAIDKIIGDMLSALKVTTYWQEADGRQAGVRVSLEGKEVLTADMAGKDGEIYVTSDLLAGTTLAMKPDEAEAVADKLLDMLVRKGMLTREQADEIRSQAETAAEAAAAEADSTATVDYEKMMEAFASNAETFTDFTDWLESMAGRVEDADVAGQPENSDPATSAKRLTLSAEDVIKAWELITEQLKANEEYMKLLDQTVEQSKRWASGEEALDAILNKLRTELPRVMQKDTVVTVYIAEDAPVAMTVDVAMAGDRNAAAVNMIYTRLTAEDGAATHTFHWDVAVDSDDVTVNGVMKWIITTREDGLDMHLGYMDEGTGMSLNLQVNWSADETERKADAVLDWSATGTDFDGTGRLDLTFEEKKTGENDAEQTVVVKLTQNDKHLFTVINESKTVDPRESIVTDDVLRLTAMTDDELDAWYDKVMDNIQVWLIKAVQALPASVLMLFMGVVE